MAKSVPQWPPAPIGLDEADFVEQLAEDALAAAAEAEVLGGGAFGFQDFEGDFQAPWMIAATDGSARDGVAAYSVVFPGGRGGDAQDGSFGSRAPHPLDCGGLSAAESLKALKSSGWEADFVEQLAEDALAAAAEAEALGGGAFGFQDFEGDFQAPWMIAATDGSARDGVAAYSVVFREAVEVPWTVFSATFGCCFDLKDVGGLLLRALFGFEGSTAAVVWRTRRAASGDTIALRAPLGLPLLVCRHGSALAVLSEVGFALTVASVLRYLLFTLTSSPTSGRLQFLFMVVRCYYEDRCLDDDLVLSFALKSAL
eukprot:s5318_g9.t1